MLDPQTSREQPASSQSKSSAKAQGGENEITPAMAAVIAKAVADALAQDFPRRQDRRMLQLHQRVAATTESTETRRAPIRAPRKRRQHMQGWSKTP